LEFLDSFLEPVVCRQLVGFFVGVRVYDHGVDRVDGSGKQNPHEGREEEAADDLAYRMSLKEAGGKVAMRGAIGEAPESGLQGRGHWSMHCLTSIGRNKARTRCFVIGIPRKDQFYDSFG
jgi:hypothetical protein